LRSLDNLGEAKLTLCILYAKAFLPKGYLMKVYVKSQEGKWLMPTHPAKARILLKKGKAKVVQRTPFTSTDRRDSS